MSSSLSVINGKTGFIIIPANIPLLASSFIACNLLEDTHTFGSIIFDNSSFVVVIINLIITLFFEFISFSKSISINIKSLFVSILTLNPYFDISFNALLVCSY
jgi:hypothetical protein